MKSLIKYLVECSGDIHNALKGFEYILQHWGELSDFTQRRMRLCDINSNIGNILIELKQKKNNSKQISGNINKNYTSTLQNLLNQKKNG